eukprot:Hpha_TRINITY_DN12026_c0_g1::TRINITY_DN12026_c0_g1_i2::g.141107::m.141107
MMMESGGGLFEDIEHEEMRCATGGKGPPPASVLESPPRSTRSKCGKEIPPVLDPVPILDWQKPLGRCEGAEWTRDDERRLRDLVVFSQSIGGEAEMSREERAMLESLRRRHAEFVSHAAEAQTVEPSARRNWKALAERARGAVSRLSRKSSSRST